MCICTRVVYLCDANTTIKMVNIPITLRSFLLPIYNPSLLLPTPPSNPGNHSSAFCHNMLLCTS